MGTLLKSAVIGAGITCVVFLGGLVGALGEPLTTIVFDIFFGIGDMLGRVITGGQHNPQYLLIVLFVSWVQVTILVVSILALRQRHSRKAEYRPDRCGRKEGR